MLMAEQYWGACRTFTGREHVVRAKIEEMDRGAFLPTFVRSWVAGGKLSVAERPAVPGYVFFGPAKMIGLRCRTSIALSVFWRTEAVRCAFRMMTWPVW
jgi:hypothetical protein